MIGNSNKKTRPLPRVNNNQKLGGRLSGGQFNTLTYNELGIDFKIGHHFWHTFCIYGSIT